MTRGIYSTVFKWDKNSYFQEFLEQPHYSVFSIYNPTKSFLGYNLMNIYKIVNVINNDKPNYRSLLEENLPFTYASSKPNRIKICTPIYVIHDVRTRCALEYLRFMSVSN